MCLLQSPPHIGIATDHLVVLNLKLATAPTFTAFRVTTGLGLPLISAEFFALLYELAIATDFSLVQFQTSYFSVEIA
jgi:hypothetical protein